MFSVQSAKCGAFVICCDTGGGDGAERIGDHARFVGCPVNQSDLIWAEIMDQLHILVRQRELSVRVNVDIRSSGVSQIL